jgi:hypothetical protein
VKAGYARNRAMLLEELPRIGITEMHPVDGAFYIYADVARFTNDSIAYCRRMLDEAGVAATPGVDFDAREGSHYLRLSFAGSEDDCREAVRRLGRGCGSRRLRRRSSAPKIGAPFGDVHGLQLLHPRAADSATGRCGGADHALGLRARGRYGVARARLAVFRDHAERRGAQGP